MRRTNPERRGIRFISPYAVIYCLVGTFFLAAGLLRGELVSSICGIALLLYLAFAFCSTLVVFFLRRNARFALEWLSQKTVRVFSSGNAPRNRSFAGFFAETLYAVQFASVPETNFPRRYSLLLPTNEPRREHTVELPKRGYYETVSVSVVIRDFSGFFSLSIPRPKDEFPEPFYAYPNPEKPAEKAFPLGRTGIARGKSAYKRSDELYEPRPYVPGDDPRKINWKVYAHTGNLSLREGELLPPPAAEYLFLFNTTISPKKSVALRQARLFDILINRATFLALELLSQNKIISFFVPTSEGHPQFLSVRPDAPDARTALLAAFSRIQLGQTVPSGSYNPDNRQTGAACLFFTLPGEIAFPNPLNRAGAALTICAGPWLIAPPRATFAEILRGLFVSAPKTFRADDSAGYRAALIHTHDELLAEGFNVARI